MPTQVWLHLKLQPLSSNSYLQTIQMGAFRPTAEGCYLLTSFPKKQKQNQTFIPYPLTSGTDLGQSPGNMSELRGRMDKRMDGPEHNLTHTLIT